MNKTKNEFHGSDLEKIQDVYGIPKENIVSFSANVNPLGFSPKAAKALTEHMEVISRYPDRDYRDLKEAIASYTKAAPENIILGNGVTELLSLFISLIAPRHALIAGPTYSEYAKDLTRTGTNIHYIDACEEDNFVPDAKRLVRETPDETDLVILCNPNNPTSGALFKEDLEYLASNFQERHIWLLIDETYAEFSREYNRITASDLTGRYDNLFVLRGTSKFFATPGLRLGYALTGNRELLDKAAKVQDPWNINSAADLVGTVMFRDTDYMELVRKTMEIEKDYVCSQLASIKGMQTYPVNGNFVLAKLPDNAPDSDELFDILIRQGMMIRSCSTFPSLGNRFIRICFMSHEDNCRLIAGIREALARF